MNSRIAINPGRALNVCGWSCALVGALGHRGAGVGIPPTTLAPGLGGGFSLRMVLSPKRNDLGRALGVVFSCAMLGPLDKGWYRIPSDDVSARSGMEGTYESHRI